MKTQLTKKVASLLKGVILMLMLVMLGSPKQVCAQIDTLFWFAAPNATSLHADSPIELRLASFNTSAVQVTIDIPAISNWAGKQTISIAAGAEATLDLTAYIADLENTLNNTVNNKGLLIKSTLPITAYYEIGRGKYNSEIYSLKGKNALGKHFFTPFQTRFANAADYFYNTTGKPATDSARSSINIVATEDNTTVTFKLTQDARSGGAGAYTGFIAKNVTYTITLNKGQTYSIFAASDLGSGRLAGSEITSDKPIAVTDSDDSVEQTSNGKDLAGDQLISVESLGSLGSRYIVTKANDGGDDFVYIVSTEDNNTITITPTTTNTPFTITLAKGETYEYIIGGTTGKDAVLIDAEKPSYVMDLSGFGVESGAPLIMPIQCTGSDKVSFVRSTNEPFFLVILAQTSAIGQFDLEGLSTIDPTQAKVTTGFTAMGTTGWSFKRVEFNTNEVPVNTAITISNSKGYFHLGMINGTNGGGSARYGYFSNFGYISSDLQSNASACQNDTISFDPTIVGVLSSAIWTNVSTGEVLQTSSNSAELNYVAKQAGNFVFQLSLKDARDCPFAGQVAIEVKPLPTVAFTPSNSTTIQVCSFDTYTLDLTATGSGNTYDWSTGSTLSSLSPIKPSESATSHIASSLVDGLVVYQVIATSSNGCTDTTAAQLNFDALNCTITGTDADKNAALFTIYPNPTENGVTITAQETNNLTATLYNATGSTLVKVSGSLVEINNNINAVLANQSAGLFIIQLNNGTSLAEQKIVKK